MIRMPLKTETWIKKTTGVDVATVTVEDFIDITNWVGQGGVLTVDNGGNATIEIYVNDEIAHKGELIVKDGEHFYVSNLGKLKEFYNKKG